MAVSSLIPHCSTYDDDGEYSDDNCSIGSYLDYCQQENDTPGYQRVDSYNFIHDTDTFTHRWTFLKLLMMSTAVIPIKTMLEFPMVFVLSTT